MEKPDRLDRLRQSPSAKEMTLYQYTAVALLQAMVAAAKEGDSDLPFEACLMADELLIQFDERGLLP